jgi:hypothetical protein
MTAGAEGADPPAVGADPLAVVEVHLLQVPLQLRRRALEHADEVAREIQLIVTGGDAPPDLVAVLARVTHSRGHSSDSYRQLAADMRVQLDAATLAGNEFADAHYTVTGAAVTAVAEMDTLFERFDGLSESDQLLTLAAPEDIKAFRRWLLGQYLTQFEGQAPESWPQWSARVAQAPERPEPGDPNRELG